MLKWNNLLFMNTVALVPLRGGSKSIPKKNIKLLAGKPLAAWCLEAAIQSKSIRKVYVSTDCEEVASVVDSLNLGVNVIMRPPELATDEASTEAVLLYFMEKTPFDNLVTIQATSPLLKTLDLDLALEYFQREKFDSMLSAVRTKRFFWNDNNTPINYDPLYRPRRQDFHGTLMENGAFYITKKSILETYKCRLGGEIGIYEMDESTSVEIDEPDDWDKVESLLVS